MTAMQGLIDAHNQIRNQNSAYAEKIFKENYAEGENKYNDELRAILRRELNHADINQINKHKVEEEMRDLKNKYGIDIEGQLHQTNEMLEDLADQYA